MKKMLIFVAIVSLLAGSLFAEEAVLIDFTQLAAGDEAQHEGTMMDFSNVRVGGSFTAEQKEAMKTSLAINNWEVILAPSARTVDNMVRSMVREAQSKEHGTVMGVRIRFPVESHNAWAMIKPPFEIPAYEPVGEDGGDSEKGSKFEGGFGVIKNVATIKSIAVNVYGLNFPHGLSTLILDNTGTQKSMFMGYLNFDGWSELIWVNPSYIQEVRNRDLRIIPLYPDSTPFIKFAGFEVRRDAINRGGDFITYFRDVKIIYDKAILDTDRDIDDEGLWNIITERENARRVWEMERFGHNQVLRYLDSQKQATEPPFGSAEREDGGSSGGGGGGGGRQDQ